MKKVEFARMMPGVLMAYDINMISYDTMPGVLMATMRCDMREDIYFIDADIESDVWLISILWSS